MIHGAANAGWQAPPMFRSFLNPILKLGIQPADSAGAHLDALGELPNLFKPPAGCAAGAGYFLGFRVADYALRVS